MLGTGDQIVRLARKEARVNTGPAAKAYRDRVDAVLAQRTRLRGAQPPGDLFSGLPENHPLMVSDARRTLEPNLEVLASYIEPDDVIVDVGGGAGRNSLPLALRAREVIVVDPSAAMLAGLRANTSRSSIENVRAVLSEWPMADPPRGTVALVNHVTYLTREIVPFLAGLEAAASRRVLLTVGDPPPPASAAPLFQLVHGEEMAVVPGYAELVDALREMGAEPEVRVLPTPQTIASSAATREAAIDQVVVGFRGIQWSLWPLAPELTARVRQAAEAHFDELFVQTGDGYLAAWAQARREILITWEPRPPIR
jgi:SAM-dependent methyltransferase